MAILPSSVDKGWKIKQTFGNLTKNIQNSYFRKYPNDFEIYQRTSGNKICYLFPSSAATVFRMFLIFGLKSKLPWGAASEQQFINCFWNAFEFCFFYWIPLWNATECAAASLKLLELWWRHPLGQVESRLKSNHLNVCFGVIVDSSSPMGDWAAVPSGCPFSCLEGWTNFPED